MLSFKRVDHFVICLSTIDQENNFQEEFYKNSIILKCYVIESPFKHSHLQATPLSYNTPYVDSIMLSTCEECNLYEVPLIVMQIITHTIKSS